VPEPHDNRATPHPESNASPFGGDAPGPDVLKVDEAYDRFGVLHIALTGELDIATGDVLRRRLRAVRASAAPVVLDLSAISFIDCYGLRTILEEVSAAERAGSRLELAFERSASVKRLLRLVRAAGVADQLPATWLGKRDLEAGTAAASDEAKSADRHLD
jgi:anti-sigma B factor antagonist